MPTKELVKRLNAIAGVYAHEHNGKASVNVDGRVVDFDKLRQLIPDWPATAMEAGRGN